MHEETTNENSYILLFAYFLVLSFWSYKIQVYQQEVVFLKIEQLMDFGKLLL